MRNAIPSLLLKLFKINNVGLEEEVVVILSLLGRVVLQILIADGCMHFLRFIKDVGDVELLCHFSRTLFSTVTTIVLSEELKEGHFTNKDY